MIDKGITAYSFFDAWIKAISNRKNELYEKWGNHKFFTSKIIGWEDSVVIDISQYLGLEVYAQDYYNIDCVFYKKEDIVYPGSKNINLKDLRVAFEHENHFKSGLYQEVSHLLLLQCDLRVLVSYPYNIETGQKELDKLHSIIKSNRNSVHFSKNESFLIIFHYEDDTVWNGFVYNELGWQLINTTGNTRL